MSTAHQAGWHAGRPRDGLRHDALQGALPQVAGQQPDQERALAVGGAAQQRGQQPAPLRLGARAGDGPDGGKGRIGLGQRQGWLRGRTGPLVMPSARPGGRVGGRGRRAGSGAADGNKSPSAA